MIFEPTERPWFPRPIPPIVMVRAGQDNVTAVDPLIRRIEQREPNVEIAEVINLPSYDHFDLVSLTQLTSVLACSSCPRGVPADS